MSTTNRRSFLQAASLAGEPLRFAGCRRQGSTVLHVLARATSKVEASRLITELLDAERRGSRR